MKKLLSLLLTMALLLACTACGTEELEPKLLEKDGQIEALRRQLEEQENIFRIKAVNATVDGKSTVEFTGECAFAAAALVPEGKVLDHWQIDGQRVEGESEQTLQFRAAEDRVVSAHFRDEKKLTTINAELRLLDANGDAAGEALTEFVFEEDYVNPVTQETCQGGKICAEIKAVIPFGKTVDYWLINGVPYYYNTGITSFTVEDLNEATTYEVVLKDIPITYYNVSCVNCTFNGNASGRVPAGTTLTFAFADSTNTSARFYVNGALVAEYVRAITATITGDTYVEAYAIIN